MIVLKVICSECDKTYDVDASSFRETNNYECPKCGSFSYSCQITDYAEFARKCMRE